MMVVLPFKQVRGHLFVEVENEHLLVDTGSPDSWSEGWVRDLVPGLRIDADRSVLEDPDELRERLGVPIVGILGMDLLGRVDVVFDLPAHELTLMLAKLPRPNGAHDLRSMMGVPVFDLPVTDESAVQTATIPVFLDSGARYSYFSPRRIAAIRVGRVRKVEDFSAILGPMEAALYETAQQSPVEPGRFRVPQRFAAPPRGLATLLRLAELEGVLGVEAFEEPVIMSMREGWVARG